MASAIKRILPLLDRILVQRAEAVTQTAGGIVIPDSAKKNVQEGKVIAVGPGARNKNGDIVPVQLKAGDRVLLPDFGGVKVKLETAEYQLFKEGDILAKLE